MIKEKKIGSDFSVVRYLRKKHNLSLKNLAERSGVSFTVISKLERNQGNPSLETLSLVARSLDLAPSELLALAEPENLALEIRTGRDYQAGGFRFRSTEFRDIRVIFGRGICGATLKNPERHRDEIEVLAVLKGRLRLELAGQSSDVSAGQSARFQAFLEHSYQALEDTELFIVHLPRRNRWPTQDPWR